MRNGYLSNRRYLAFGAVRLMDGGGRILGVHHDFYVAVTVLQGGSRLSIPHGNAAREVHVPAVLLIQFLDCFNLVDGALVCRVGQLNRLICIVTILECGNLSTVVGTQRLVGALEGRFFTVRNGLEGLRYVLRRGRIRCGLVLAHVFTGQLQGTGVLFPTLNECILRYGYACRAGRAALSAC